MKISAVDKKQIIKDSTKYLSATIIGQIVGLIRSILVPIILSPGQLGIWNLMNVIIGYGNNAHLGILHGMNKIIPMLRGQGKESQIENIKNSVFWTNFLLCTIWFGVLITASFYAPKEYANGIRLTSVVIYFQGIFLYLFSLIRAENRFNLVSLGVGGLSILSTTFVILFGSLFQDKLIGMLIGLVGAYALTVIYFLIRGGYRFRFYITYQAISNSFSMGIPLVILAFLDSLFLSIDRWFIVSHFNEFSLGYYAIGISASGLLGLIPGSISSVLYPKMLERFGENKTPNALSGLLIGPTRVVAILMSLLIGGSVLFFPLIIKFLLPKYYSSIIFINILLPAVYFYALSFIPGSFLVSINKQNLLIQIQIIASIASLILNFALYKIGFGIVGVAWATAISYFIYGFGYLYFASFYSFSNFKERMLFLLQIFIVFIPMLIGLYSVKYIIPEGDTIARSIILTSLSFIFYVTMLLPIIWWSNRKGEILSAVFNHFKNQ